MRRFLLIALTTLALLLVGCGTSGGEKASSGTKAGASTTTADGSSDPSDDEGDPTTTPDDDDEGPGKVTSEQLEEILPTAADIGPGYTLEEPDEDDDDTSTTEGDAEPDPSDAAFEEACPKAKALDLMDDEENDDEVSVEFKTELDQGIEVSLDPTPVGASKEKLDEIIDAFNDCGTIEYDDPDNGAMKLTLSAERLEDVGDFGVKVMLGAEVALFGIPIKIDFTGYLLVVDGIGVTVTATSGLDPNTFEPTAADTDLLAPISAEMEQRVQSITD